MAQLGSCLRPLALGVQPVAVQHAVSVLLGCRSSQGREGQQAPPGQALDQLTSDSFRSGTAVLPSHVRSYCVGYTTSDAEVRRGLHSFNAKRSASSGYSETSKEAEVLFERCWREMEERFGQDYWAPREIVWLNGAPGSGKGANTRHILKVRGLNRAVTISSLLDGNATAQDYIQRGDMVPEMVVMSTLMEAIFNPDSADHLGLLVDGFPRTSLQVDFVKLLYERLQSLHEKYAGTPFADRFPRPSFKIIMMYVDEATSVNRQMQRAAKAKQHNERVLDAGGDELREQRATDLSVVKCQKRYDLFRQHYAVLLELKQQFPFTLIDAMCSIRGIEEQISRELRYQSSMDLHEATYAALRHIPLARDLAKSARQELVIRLDSYCLRHSELFAQVMHLVDGEVVPLLRRCGLAGNAEFISDDPLFDTHPMAIDMLIDILTDRGFGVHHAKENYVVPLHFDLNTGRIASNREVRHHFHITFNVKGVRGEARAVPGLHLMQHSLSDPVLDYGITKSFIPVDAEQDQRVEALARAHQQAVWAHRLQRGWLPAYRGGQASVNRVNVAQR